MRRARLGDEVVDAALRLTKRRVDSPDTLLEPTTVVRMGAERGLPYDDRATNGALGDVVGRLDAVVVDEGPERVGVLEQPC